MTSSIYSFKLYLIQGQAPGWEEEVCRVDAALSLGGKFYSNLRFTVKNYIIKKKKRNYTITTHPKHFMISQCLALNLAGNERLIFPL